MKYDVAIIGGGPAGMMAAGRAGELGARVILIEKNMSLGIKLLMTGSGRCNVTHYTEDSSDIVEKFGKNGKFLYSALNVYSVKDAMAFFEENGVPLKIEEGEKVYPRSDSACDILDALKKYMEASGVEIRAGSGVREMISEGKTIKKIILEDGDEVEAGNFIICTGGLSYPNTGSTGDGYEWAKKLGHTVTNLYPALSPIIVEDKIVEELEGLSLKNVEIGIYKNNRKIDSRRGEAIFTKNGLSGPIILDAAKDVGSQLPGVSIKIDFKPDLDFEMLDMLLQKDFYAKRNKLFKNSLDRMLPKKLIPVIVKLSGINSEKKVNAISKCERKIILHLVKEFALHVAGLHGFEKAVVTAGGIKLSEVDPKTMKSKLVNNLFFAGEVLDLDGKTGGYNLQMCWSTGRVAGESAGRQARRG